MLNSFRTIGWQPIPQRIGNIGWQPMPRIGLLAAIAVLLLPMVVRAQGFKPPAQNPMLAPPQYVPDELKKVSVDEHLGNKVPLDLTFTDDAGKPVQLSSYFDGRRPVILQLGYYKCPMLCDLVSQGLVSTVKDLGLDASKDYQLLFVSIDPKEQWKLAKDKKQSYLDEYKRPGTENGWHFLVGQFTDIDALTKAVGFNYKYVPAQEQYSHPAVLVLLTPQGKISRYLYGVQFDKQTLRLSLVEASDNKIGTTVDHFILTCLQYDGTQGRYAASAMKLMRYGGALTLVVLAFVLWQFFRMERRKSAQKQKPSTA